MGKKKLFKSIHPKNGLSNAKSEALKQVLTLIWISIWCVNWHCKIVFKCKSHGLLKTKLWTLILNFILDMIFDMVHWFMLCYLGTWIYLNNTFRILKNQRFHTISYFGYVWWIFLSLNVSGFLNSIFIKVFHLGVLHTIQNSDVQVRLNINGKKSWNQCIVLP